MKNKVRVGLIIIVVIIVLNISSVFSMGRRVEKNKAESVVQKKETPGLKNEKVIREKKQDNAIVKAGVENKIVYEKKVLFEGKYGTNPGEYNACPDSDQTIYWIVLDMQGNIYLLDYLNDRIQKYGKDGNFLKIIPIKCTEVRKEQNYIIENGEKLKHGYNLIPTFKIRRFWVDKDGYIYAYESVNKECIKYDQEGNEKGRTKKGVEIHFINGRPYIVTGENEITYIKLEGNSVITMEVKELPAGIKTVKGNYYADDFEKLNSYWIENGKDEKEKKIVVKNKDGETIRELKIIGDGKIDYFNIVHIDKYGSIWVSFGGKDFYFSKIFSLKSKILAETKYINEIGKTKMRKIVKEIPFLAWMEYIMDGDGNIYKLENGDSSLTLTKWERKYIE